MELWAILLLIPSAFILDRALLRCERRGWIYYRKRKASGGNTAMMNMGSFLNPGAQETVQYLESERKMSVEINNNDRHDS